MSINTFSRGGECNPLVSKIKGLFNRKFFRKFEIFSVNASAEKLEGYSEFPEEGNSIGQNCLGRPMCTYFTAFSGGIIYPLIRAPTSFCRSLSGTSCPFAVKNRKL